MKRSLMPVLAVGALLAPAVALAQGVTIDHKAIGCIVAEQYPKMNACFLPRPSVARTRVNFRAGGTTHWYWVDGKREMPCDGYVLPKPKKTIKFVEYYVEFFDTGGGEGRTSDYAPVVVLRESECKKDVPVAPYLTRASVVVGVPAGAPAIVPGFTGFIGAGAGLSTGAILGIVAAGGAVAGTAVALSGGDNNPPIGPTPGPPTTAVSATTTTTTTTTTTLKPPGFNAVFKIFPSPPQGKEPLEVTFDECESTGVNLRFLYDFDGDGLEDHRGGCRETRVYRLSGVGTSTAATTLPPATRVFPATVCVASGSTNRECMLWRVVVSENTGLSVSPAEVTAASRRVAWTSDLDLEGGSGQVVVNGESAAFASRGRSAGAAVGRRGLNRIEAQVVESAGRPGTWRFELDTTGSLQSGSIRVIAGEVALLTESAIVFRLKGKPGERAVFVFRTDR